MNDNGKVRVPDVASDYKVINARDYLSDVIHSYMSFAAEFEGEPESFNAEHHMFLIENYELPAALDSLSKAVKKFYKQHPDGVADPEIVARRALDKARKRAAVAADHAEEAKAKLEAAEAAANKS